MYGSRDRIKLSWTWMWLPLWDLRIFTARDFNCVAFSCVCFFFGGEERAEWNLEVSKIFTFFGWFSKKKTQRTLADLRFSEQPL